MKFYYLILLLGLTAWQPIKETRPNVLFISIDDLRPDLGCYGNTTVKSPNINALAKSGSVFMQHYVQVPTCGASRYSMLSGRRPTNKNMLTNEAFTREITSDKQQEVPESFIEQLKKSGYHTIGIGKISHSADGYDYGYTEERSNKLELPNSWDEMLFNPGKWETGWNSFFGYEDGENRQSLNKKVKPYEKGILEKSIYPDDLTASLAVQKLDSLQNTSQPFFMAVGFFKPHLPFNAPAKYWDLYHENEIPLSPNPRIPKNVNLSSLHGSHELNSYQLGDEVAGLENPITDAYARKLRQAYYASISYVDAQVGLVLTELKRKGLDKNTIVVIWGDHGWHLGDQQVWGKHTLFENALKSTFIIKLPNKKTIPKVETIVESLDIYPTLLSLCKVNIPIKPDGKDISELLYKRKKAKIENVAYSYYNNGISLRTSRYRLTKYYRKQQPTIELYDHDRDPNETENVAARNPEIVRRLMPLLEKGNTSLYGE